MSQIQAHPERRKRNRGFTLVEVLIAATLSSLILAGVVASFLMLGRSGTNMGNYADMEAEARRSLELFAQDVRQASGITWNSDTNVTLSFSDQPNVTYTLGGTGNSKFLRIAESGASNAIISGVDPTTFYLRGYTVNGFLLPVATTDERTTANRDTKQLQLQLKCSRNSTTVTTATNAVLSARFILRNKQVTS